jgi:DNA-binding SARP family transcriptional activator
MEFRILGPLQVLDGDRPIEIAGSKRRAVLALLLLHANEVVRTERLVDDLWGEQAPRNASAALHNHVSRLRKALGPDVLGRREWGYVLRADVESIDLHRFERLLAEAEPLPAVDRSAKLAHALKLWRGPALADIANEPGLQSEIARLDELRLTTQERRIDADLEAGRNSELVGEIEALIAAHPLREHLRWQLILALYRAGRQAEALEIYRETRRVLSEELGLEPSPELRELEKAILRQDPTIAPVAQTPRAAEPVRRKRRALLFALAALGLIGLGLGAAFAFADFGRSHATVRGMPVGLTTSVPSITVTTTTTTPSTTTPTHHRSPSRRHVSRSSHLSPRAVRRSAVVAAVVPAAAAVNATSTKSSATTTTSPRRPTSKPRIVTISDNFDGNQIDGTIWYQIYQGSGWTLSEHSGHLEFAFPTGTAPGGQYDNYGGHVGTLCKFPGNFDARVDFSLPQWPPTNGVSVNLWAFYGPNNSGWAGVWRSSSAQWGEQYGGAVASNPGGGVSLDDVSGTVRMRRHNGLLSELFLHNGKWIRLASGYTTATLVITVGASSAQNPPARSDRVVVDFNNFTVTASNPICPSGAQGST